MRYIMGGLVVVALIGGLAGRSGAGDDFKVVTEKKIEVILLTDSSKAVAKKGQESNRLSATKRPEFEAAHQNERRRYKRFRLPALLVTVAGRTYASNSWSIGGGALPGWEGSDSGRFEAKLKAEGNDTGFSDTIEVVSIEYKKADG